MEDCLDITDNTYKNYTEHRDKSLSTYQLKELDKMIQQYSHMNSNPTENINTPSTTTQHIQFIQL